MSEPVDWLPSWRRFLSWRGRLRRVPFFIGCLTVAVIAGAAGLAFLALGPSNYFIFFLVAEELILLSALLTQRAHDIGWSALIPHGVFLILGAPGFALILDDSFGLFGHPFTANMEMRRLLMAVAIICSSLWLIFVFSMMIRQGSH